MRGRNMGKKPNIKITQEQLVAGVRALFPLRIAEKSLLFYFHFVLWMKMCFELRSVAAGRTLSVAVRPLPATLRFNWRTFSEISMCSSSLHDIVTLIGSFDCGAAPRMLHVHHSCDAITIRRHSRARRSGRAGKGRGQLRKSKRSSTAKVVSGNADRLNDMHSYSCVFHAFSAFFVAFLPLESTTWCQTDLHTKHVSHSKLTLLALNPLDLSLSLAIFPSFSFYFPFVFIIETI